MDLSIDLNPLSPTFGDVLLDATGDLVLTSDADPEGTHPVLQNILQNLRTFQGEWFLDLSVGVPYYQKILAKGTKQSDIQAELRNTVLNTIGVVQLTQFSVQLFPSQRRMTVQFSGSSTAGPFNYSGTLPFNPGGSQA